MVWEIVRGSYGATYTATIEDENYSGFTAALYVWARNNHKVLDGKSCSVSYSSPDTTISYLVATGDFPSTMATGNYNGLIKLSRGSPAAEERSLKFSLTVYEDEP